MLQKKSRINGSPASSSFALNCTPCTVLVHSPFPFYNLSSLTAPQMSTHSSTISFEEFILLSPGYHVLLLSVVLHATMIMCILVRLLICQLWVSVIVMDSTFMQKSDWLPLQASAFFTSFCSMCCKSKNAVLKKQGSVKYKKMFPFGSEDTNNHSNRKEFRSLWKTVLFFLRMSFKKAYGPTIDCQKQTECININLYAALHNPRPVRFSINIY